MIAKTVAERGKSKVHFCHYSIKIPNACVVHDGRISPAKLPPYFVKNLDEPFHPGGNSLCYAMQYALMMGADPIYLMGFTLVSGSGYEFGRNNPVKKIRGRSRPTLYETERAMEWLREVEKHWPGRVRLLPGWEGPLYDLFDVDPIARAEQPHEEPVQEAQKAEEAEALPFLRTNIDYQAEDEFLRNRVDQVNRSASPLPPVIPDERPTRARRPRLSRGIFQSPERDPDAADL